jgi:hypothetical protein
MQGGGETGIIERWQQVAGAKPDRRRRGDYGGLVLVFAELTENHDRWSQTLEDWNVIESPQVLERIQQGKTESLKEGIKEGTVQAWQRHGGSSRMEAGSSPPAPSPNGGNGGTGLPCQAAARPEARPPAAGRGLPADLSRRVLLY